MLRTSIFKKYTSKSVETLIDKEANLRFELLIEPQNVKKLKELGKCLYYRKEKLEAIKIFEKLLKLEPENVEVMAFLGYLYYEAEQFPKALEMFKVVIKSGKITAFEYFLLGNICSRLGMIKEAIKSYDRAIFLGLDLYEVHIEFANKYLEMNRVDKALKEYIAAYEIDPRDSKVLDKINELKAMQN